MSPLQLHHLTTALRHAVETQGLKYVWIDWSCVPQYR